MDEHDWLAERFEAYRMLGSLSEADDGCRAHLPRHAALALRLARARRSPAATGSANPCPCVRLPARPSLVSLLVGGVDRGFYVLTGGRAGDRAVGRQDESVGRRRQHALRRLTASVQA